MKSKTAKSIHTLLGLVIMIGLIIAAIFILKYILGLIISGVEWLATLSERLDAVIIVALVSAVVTIITAIIAKVTEYRQKTKRCLFEKREEPYKNFIEIIYKLRKKTKAGEEYSESEMIADIDAVSKGLTLWGSNRVIKKWIKFRTCSVDKTRDPKDNLFVLEDILFDIRHDMGHRKGLLQKGDLLKFFVNDVDEALLKSKSKKRG